MHNQKSSCVQMLQTTIRTTNNKNTGSLPDPKHTRTSTAMHEDRGQDNKAILNIPKAKSATPSEAN